MLTHKAGSYHPEGKVDDPERYCTSPDLCAPEVLVIAKQRSTWQQGLSQKPST